MAISKWLTDLKLKSPEDTTYYPVRAFYFKVVIPGFSDTSFQDVSGLERELETEDVVEGGENGFIHRLPTKMKHQRLVLKRGITTRESGLVTWCKNILENGGFVNKIEPKMLQVLLMDGNGNAVRTWDFYRAYPVKWSVDGLNSSESKLAIETIEMSYTGFEITAKTTKASQSWLSKLKI